MTQPAAKKTKVGGSIAVPVEFVGLLMGTLGIGKLEPYDFTRSLAVGIKEFAPDRIVLLGPGETMGGAIGQGLVAEKWLGIADKAGFAARQAADPFLIAMGRADQRERVA